MCSNHESLLYVFKRLNRQLHRILLQEYKENLVPPAQISLMRVLEEKVQLSQRDIADELDIRPSSVTNLLNKLEEQELIKRIPDEKDMRGIKVFLTDKGKEKAKQFKKSQKHVCETLFSCLSAHEEEELLILLEKLCKEWELIEIELDDFGLENNDNLDIRLFIKHLKDLHLNPHVFLQRMRLFDITIDDVEAIMRSKDINPKDYINIIKEYKKEK